MLEIRGLSKSFPGRKALDNVSLKIAAGEFFSLLGPSGCGKSTLLRILAELDAADTGEILWDGIDISRMSPQQRPFNMVFQSYALFPHMSVWDNVCFGPRMRGEKSAATKKLALEMLEMVALGEFAQAKVTQLSGGQQQRVALARAIINRPKMLLLDEPLSALDLKLRQSLQSELHDLQRRLAITFLFVTHAQDEALALSDKIAVMHLGRVEQVASPLDLYETPSTPMVAHFIGDSTEMIGRWVNGVFVETATGDVWPAARGRGDSGKVRCFIRPEHVTLGAGAGAFSAVVHALSFRGHQAIVTLFPFRRETMQGLKVLVSAHEAAALKVGSDVLAAVRWEAVAQFVGGADA